MNQKKYGILLSYISLITTILTGILYTPVMLRLLGQNEYGLYQLANSLVTYLSLLNLGLNGSYIKFYMREKVNGDEQSVARINGMFLLLFCVISLISIIIGIVLVTNIRILGNNYSNADYKLIQYLMIFMIINMAISFPNTLFASYMSACEDFVFQRVIGLITNILIPVINIPILYCGYGSRGMVTFATILTIIKFIINIWYCFSKLQISFLFHGFHSEIFRELANFTFFIFLSDLVDQLNQNVDKLLLGKILGAVSVAIYSVAYSIKTYFTQISWAIPEVYIPEVNALTEEKAYKKINNVFVRTGRMSNIVLAPIVIGFIIFGQKFINLWAGVEYAEAYWVTVILLISAYIPALQSIGVNIQNAMNMHRMRSIVYFGVAIGNVILSIQLIPRFGVVGTAMGTLIAIVLGNGLFMNIYYQKKIGLNIIEFWKQIARMCWAMFPATVCGIILRTLMPQQKWAILFVQLFLFVLIYVGTMWKFGLNDEEREIGKKGFRKLVNKFR